MRASPLRIPGLFVAALVVLGACGTAGTGETKSTVPGRVAIVGDSITEQSADVINDALNGHDVRILARIGNTFGSSQNNADLAAAGDPAIVIIELGTNDVWTETPTPVILEELDQMLAKFPDACVAIVTLNESARNARSLDGTVYDNVEARALNERLRSRVDHVVDWDAAVNADPTRYLDRGTIHPTPDGRVLLASMMSDAVDDCAG